MIQLHQEYPGLFSIWPLPVAQLKNSPSVTQKGQPAVAQLTAEPDGAQIWQQGVAKLPWAYSIILVQKVKLLPAPLWHALRLSSTAGAAMFFPFRFKASP
jgi:hypothetical protein